MQIQTPVGGEVTPPSLPNDQQPAEPAVDGGAQIPVTPDAGVAPAVEDGGDLGENPSAQETVTPGTETAQPVDAAATAEAEAAGLEEARQAVGSGAAGPVEQAAAAPAEQVVQDRKAVNDVLNPGTGDPAATAVALEGTVADNHLETPDPLQEAAANGNIGQVAATDQAGPEPVPAPPAAASVITPETPDNLTASETQSPAAPGGETVPPPPPPPLPDPASTPAPEGSFVDTTGMPLSPQAPQAPPQAGAQMGPGGQTLTSTEEVSEAMRQVDQAYGDPSERPTSPDAAMARRMIEEAMVDAEAVKARLEKLHQAFEAAAPGSEKDETQAGEA